jgi:uncharacterized UBP type Zn finger protein
VQIEKQELLLYNQFIKRVPRYLIKRADEVIHSVSLKNKYSTLCNLSDLLYKHTKFHIIDDADDDVGGYMDYKNHIIFISPWNKAIDDYATFLHELSHIFQYDEGIYNWSTIDTIWASEKEADTLAVYMQLGIEEQVRTNIGRASCPYYYLKYRAWLCERYGGE